MLLTRSVIANFGTGDMKGHAEKTTCNRDCRTNGLGQVVARAKNGPQH